MKKLKHTEDPDRLRRERMPEVGEQLGAMWKILAARFPETLDDPVYKQVIAAKAAIPKGTK